MIKRSFILALIIVLIIPDGLSSVPQDATDDSRLYFYRVSFIDKGNVSTGDFEPEQLLSHAAIARREKCGISLLSYSDLPVSTEYISLVIQKGLTFRYASKWMNTGLFSSESTVDIQALEELPCIDKIKLVKLPAEPAKNAGSKYGMTVPASPGEAFDPNIPVGGATLQQSGFTGKNVIIAVLDAGFVNADVIESLTALRHRNGIITTYDFVSGSPFVFDYHTHGTSVLTILAGSLPGVISGTATGADYMLLRTEDSASEYPVEEDFWVAGAEYADSAGADIITTSLGYFMFDDHAMDYSFSDMDGNTAFVTRAADIAASKGILVVASAGNERNKEWIRIIAPSDGDSVLCIGALYQDLTISDFSSAGYSSDGRVKPDVVAPGVNLPLQNEPGKWLTGSGTSFSCPVISGLCATLMQAVPGVTASEIITAVQESGDRYNNPDSLYGYGLPDFVSALKKLEEIHTFKPEVIMTAGPNPFNDEIKIWFRETPGHLSVSVTDNSGRTIIRREFFTYAARSFTLGGFGRTGQGIYYVRVSTDQGERTFKMIRIRK
jgi:serine protease AprX